MKKRIYIVLSLCLLLSLIPGAAHAGQESPPLHLGLVRNFGYGGVGKIQGSFTLKIVEPPAGLAKVSFYLDGVLLEEVQEEPFRVKFHTSEYESGEHSMTATGTLVDGTILESNRITKTFLSSDQAWSETQGIILPLLLGVGALTLIGIGAPFLLGRKKEFVLGKYGPAGGAVCPRCGLPFSRTYLAPNLMVGKLVRCPHCGKVSILPMASRAQLSEAEQRYEGAESAGPISEGKDDLRKIIDESRFED